MPFNSKIYTISTKRVNFVDFNAGQSYNFFEVMGMQKIFEGWKWGPMTVKNVVSVKTHSSSRRTRSGGNTQAYQLGVKFTGRSEISYNGENVDFCPGTALFLPKEKTDDIDYTTLTLEGGTGVCIFFDSELPLSQKVQILKNIGKDCENAYMKLLSVYTKSGDYAEVMAAFYSLLSLLFKASNPEGEKEGKRARFEKVTDYMESHACDEYPDIGRMARMVGMSEKYFRDSFRAAFGIPPLQYFHRLKINCIKSMLAELDMPIYEVARANGFSDPNYFARFFKKHAGISPSEYRKYYCAGL